MHTIHRNDFLVIYQFCDAKYRSANSIIKGKSFEVNHSSRTNILQLKNLPLCLKIDEQYTQQNKKGSRNLALDSKFLLRAWRKWEPLQRKYWDLTPFYSTVNNQESNYWFTRFTNLHLACKSLSCLYDNWIQKVSSCIHRYGNVRPNYVHLNIMLCESKSDKYELRLHLINDEKNHNCPKSNEIENEIVLWVAKRQHRAARLLYNMILMR